MAKHVQMVLFGLRSWLFSQKDGNCGAFLTIIIYCPSCKLSQRTNLPSLSLQRLDNIKCTKMDVNKINRFPILGGSAELQDSNMKKDEAMFSGTRQLQILMVKTEQL